MKCYDHAYVPDAFGRCEHCFEVHGEEQGTTEYILVRDGNVVTRSLSLHEIAKSTMFETDGVLAVDKGSLVERRLTVEERETFLTDLSALRPFLSVSPDAA